MARKKYKSVQCPHCDGRGYRGAVDRWFCWNCEGTGKIRKLDINKAELLKALEDTGDDPELEKWENEGGRPEKFSDDCVEMHERAGEVTEGEARRNPVKPNELEEEEGAKKTKKKPPSGKSLKRGKRKKGR